MKFVKKLKTNRRISNTECPIQKGRLPGTNFVIPYRLLSVEVIKDGVPAFWNAG
jgi:hypothetical protein